MQVVTGKLLRRVCLECGDESCLESVGKEKGFLSFSPGFNRVTEGPLLVFLTVSTVSDFLGRT